MIDTSDGGGLQTQDIISMDNAMERGLTRIWKDAWNIYHSELTEGERARIEQVGSLEQLMDRVTYMQASYQTPDRHFLSLMLARADPFISQLRSFSAIINILVSSHPEIAALVWGSVSIVLEVGHYDTWYQSSCEALTLGTRSWRLVITRHWSILSDLLRR